MLMNLAITKGLSVVIIFSISGEIIWEIIFFHVLHYIKQLTKQIKRLLNYFRPIFHELV